MRHGRRANCAEARRSLGCGDARLRIAFAAQANESFAFEVQHVLFAHRLGLGERADDEDVHELALNHRIKLADVADQQQA
jgi:hypothetical protein